MNEQRAALAMKTAATMLAAGEQEAKVLADLGALGFRGLRANMIVALAKQAAPVTTWRP